MLWHKFRQEGVEILNIQVLRWELLILKIQISYPLIVKGNALLLLLLK